ncbi:TorF family putative porin [Paraburkholderia acidicola]|uniref:TorF family putative porin n=1 Tax=Paraburkholderia acidicola TaxID=1912599 RepID=A0ABV1LRP9_9BURK
MSFAASPIRWLASFALAVALHAPAAAADWQFEISAATDKVSRGMELSDGRPSATLAASWYPGNGFFAGVSASSVRVFPAAPTGVEFSTDVGYAWRTVDDWSVGLMLSHYQFLGGSEAARYNYDELVLTTGWHDLVFASVAVSPDTAFGWSPRSFAVSYDLVGHVPLVHGWMATAGIGYYDLHSVTGSGYVYGDAGLTYQYRALQFDLLYVLTNGEAKKQFGSSVSDRWVADVIWHF